MDLLDQRGERAHDDLVHVHVVRLLDCILDGAADGVRLDRHLAVGFHPFARGLVADGSIRLWNTSFALNAAAIVPCVLITVPMVSPGSSGLVSTNAMVFIINLALLKPRPSFTLRSFAVRPNTGDSANHAHQHRHTPNYLDFHFLAVSGGFPLLDSLF